MRTKTVINAKGERQATRIEIPVEGSGGALGMHAVESLTKLISATKSMEKPEDVVAHWYVISGFAMCCQSCGFLTEKSTDDIMHMAEELTNIELERAERQQAGKGNQ